ncbi:hypothetical protein ARMGADRAFT_1020427, partial [Armillaria gallica]
MAPAITPDIQNSWGTLKSSNIDCSLFTYTVDSGNEFELVGSTSRIPFLICVWSGQPVRGSQRQAFFVVSDVALFENNSAEIIGCSLSSSLDRDRLPVRLPLLILTMHSPAKRYLISRNIPADSVL